MRKLEQLALSIQHYFQSKGKYRLHSDLAYRLYTEVHNEQKVVFSDHWNSPWSKDLSPYTKTDFGTGQDQRLIDVVKHKNAASTKLEVQRLHNLVSFCKARNILELGVMNIFAQSLPHLTAVEKHIKLVTSQENLTLRQNHLESSLNISQSRMS